ncbi:MAG: choice-of-anchor Q domain-containing protein [Solirubrobacterales bacterium]
MGGLANNGGPTQTQMPAVTSPVVDKGISPGPLTTDQRGDPRRVDTSVPNAADGTDIGAVELSTGPPGEAPAGAVPTVRIHGIKKKKHGKRVLHTFHNRLKAHIFFTSRVPGLVFLCRADKHHFKRCTSPFTVRLSSAPGKGKAHRIQVIAVDPATGQRSKTKTIRFRIVRKTGH